MQLSAVSQNFQNLVKLVCAWTTKELPDFPFSSLQINYNYAVARGVPRRLPLSPRGDGVDARCISRRPRNTSTVIILGPRTL